MNLDDYDFTICKKAGTKLSTPARLSKVLKSKRILMRCLLKHKLTNGLSYECFMESEANDRTNYSQKNAFQLLVSHLTFTFSKSIIETVEKSVKYVQS